MQGTGIATAATALLLAVAAAGCGASAGSAAPPAPGSVEPTAGGDAAAYCIEQGGRVVTRQAVYGTNAAEESRIELGDPRSFCNFEAAEPEEGSDFRTQIELDLVSLHAERPTLAILAYLEATPPDMDGQGPGSNPASAHCAQLGGTIHFGRLEDQSGGGWVKAAGDSTTAFDQADLCVFPDGSMIDSWGITYHSGGIIRGVDLASVIRYRPDAYPPVYGPVVSPSPAP